MPTASAPGRLARVAAHVVALPHETPRPGPAPVRVGVGGEVKESKEEYPLVRAEGSAWEMGYQHGQQAAPLINKYLAWILRGRDPELVVADALTHEPGIQRLNPRLLEEVRGLAAGAGISYGEAMVCQTRGGGAVGASTAEAGADTDGCTAFALTGAATLDGQPIAGQNQDISPEMDEFGIVLHLTPTDGRPRAVTFTFAGQLGYMGMNSEGVSHFANAVPDVPAADGAPPPECGHYPLKRTCFEQHSVEDCGEHNHDACSRLKWCCSVSQRSIS